MAEGLAASGRPAPGLVIEGRVARFFEDRPNLRIGNFTVADGELEDWGGKVRRGARVRRLGARLGLAACQSRVLPFQPVVEGPERDCQNFRVRAMG